MDQDRWIEGALVNLIEGRYAGQSGEVFGSIRRVDARRIGAESEPIITFYQVRLDETDEIVFIEDYQLALIWS